MFLRKLAAFSVLGICSLTALAPSALTQMGTTTAAPAAGSIATPAAAFDSQLTLIEKSMMGAVKAMPADKFSFAPSQAIFAPGEKTEFAKVRTFAQQATHVAEANYFFYNIVSGLKPDVDVKNIEKLTSKDDVVAALAGSFAFAHKAIATLTANNAFEVIKSPEPGFQTRGTLASFGISHCWDHYGQMVVYLRMNGIVPPASQ
jgi:uncharacterized damage-inducible protein DinB